ncbi:MAG: TadE family protein [Alphaproteobacteria bacterium]
MKRLLTRLKNDEGVGAIEFALITPIFMAFTFGIIVYGFYFATLIGLEQAAAEGARAAVRGLTNAERITLATEAVDRTLENYGGLIDDVLVVRNIEVDPVNPGLFRVELTYNFNNGPFGDLGAFVPLPAGGPNVETIVSNGGF